MLRPLLLFAGLFLVMSPLLIHTATHQPQSAFVPDFRAHAIVAIGYGIARSSTTLPPPARTSPSPALVAKNGGNALQ